MLGEKEAEQLEIEAKYEGYVLRQEREIKSMKSSESLRLSAGIEDAEDILADIEQALGS